MLCSVVYAPLIATVQPNAMQPNKLSQFFTRVAADVIYSVVSINLSITALKVALRNEQIPSEANCKKYIYTSHPTIRLSRVHF